MITELEYCKLQYPWCRCPGSASLRVYMYCSYVPCFSESLKRVSRCHSDESGGNVRCSDTFILCNLLPCVGKWQHFIYRSVYKHDHVYMYWWYILLHTDDLVNILTIYVLNRQPYKYLIHTCLWFNDSWIMYIINHDIDQGHELRRNTRIIKQGFWLTRSTAASQSGDRFENCH